jgi:hypothetical protein
LRKAGASPLHDISTEARPISVRHALCNTSTQAAIQYGPNQGAGVGAADEWET